MRIVRSFRRPTRKLCTASTCETRIADRSGEPARVTGTEFVAFGEGLDDRRAEGRYRDAPASTFDHCLANERLTTDVVLHDRLVIVEEDNRVHFDGRRATRQ